MRRVIALALGAVLVAGCTSGEDAEPVPTTEPTTSTSLVDRSGVALPGVGGETTTTIVDVGTARLFGTVQGPAGPLPGATVRIERIVAGTEIRRDVTTDGDGTWELRGVPGGRYRVRAYLAPLYAQTTAEVRFLADGDEHRFDLVVDDQRGVLVRADVAPDQPIVDAGVNLIVLVVERTVDPDGVVRSTPLSNLTVELAGLGRWVVFEEERHGGIDGTTSTTFARGSSTVAAVLSAGGRARFELRCVAAGAPGLVLRVPVSVDADPGSASSSSSTSTGPPTSTVDAVALDLPACAKAAATPSTSTTTTSSTTSSTTP